MPAAPVVLALPFRGTWVVQNSPARRVPSHGTHLFATTYAIDFVAVHDGEPDHEARRSPFALLAYAVTQASRARAGAGALAGNHVVVELADGAGFVVLAHLREGSLRVGTGDAVTTGRAVGECGNSGNSTQPHVHLQVMDCADPYAARGLPLAFRDYRVRPRRGGDGVVVGVGVPDDADVVEPL